VVSNTLATWWQLGLHSAHLDWVLVSPSSLERLSPCSIFASTRISLSAKGGGAATDEAPLQAFQGRLFQQDQRVADIIAVRLGMRRENLLDAGGQLTCQRRAFDGLVAEWRRLMLTPGGYLHLAEMSLPFQR